MTEVAAAIMVYVIQSQLLPYVCTPIRMWVGCPILTLVSCVKCEPCIVGTAADLLSLPLLCVSIPLSKPMPLHVMLCADMKVGWRGVMELLCRLVHVYKCGYS